MAKGADPVRINLGSGAHCPPGWTHVDNSIGAWLGKRPRLFAFLRATMVGPLARLLPAPGWGPNCERMDLTRPLRFPTAFADAVHASHVLEHLTLDEGQRLLLECHRILKPGGVLRMIVPDLAALVSGYERERHRDPAGAAAWFLANTGFADYPPPRATWRLPLWIVRRRHNHAFIYDEPALRRAYENAGFTAIRRRGFGESDIPGILEIEVSSRLDGAICLEARKAG